MLFTPMRVLLFGALGLGGLLLFTGTASAATPATEPEEKKPAPKPSGTTAAAASAATAQNGGQSCKAAFDEWSSLADRAAALCAEAAQATDVWWQWEELRLANDSSYDPLQQERARARWEEAQDNCTDINSSALAAMARYEACMTALGLNPALPSAATGY